MAKEVWNQHAIGKCNDRLAPLYLFWSEQAPMAVHHPFAARLLYRIDCRTVKHILKADYRPNHLDRVSSDHLRCRNIGLSTRHIYLTEQESRAYTNCAKEIISWRSRISPS